MKKKSSHTSWESSSSWYDKIVGSEGHTYHQLSIFPNLLRILNLKPGAKLLDLACGQGVLSHQLPEKVEYVGVDLSPSLIQSAKRRSQNRDQQFQVGDITKPLSLKKKFTHATLILAYQNLEKPEGALKNGFEALVPGGEMVVVLNHPCFRIPRQSSWEQDLKNGVQQRKISRYMSEMEIPITTHPGKEESAVTKSFHSPLHSIFGHIAKCGFVVAGVEEWCSPKESTGARAKMENRARLEFPLFLTLILRKPEDQGHQKTPKSC